MKSSDFVELIGRFELPTSSLPIVRCIFFALPIHVVKPRPIPCSARDWAGLIFYFSPHHFVWFSIRLVRLLDVLLEAERTAQLEREGMYWTEDEKEHLRQFIWDGLDITEIALNLQRTEMAVLQQAQLMGLYGKVRNCLPREQKGKCLCERCLRKGVCTSYLDKQNSDAMPSD